MMFKKLLPILLLAGGSLLAADFSVGVHFGPPPPPRVVYYRPARPGPTMYGSTGIGIRTGAATVGTTVIGRARRVIA